MNPEDFLKLIKLQLAEIDNLNIDAKILSDNQTSVKFQYKEGNKIFNIHNTFNFYGSNNQNEKDLEKTANNNIPLVKQQLINSFENHPQILNQIGLGVPPTSLASYLQGTVSANASLATINPHQPMFIPEPKTFEQSHKIDFEPDEKGNFKSTTLLDLLSGKTK